MRYKFTEDDNVVEYDENGKETSLAVSKVGYVFYYPEVNVCSVIESDPLATKEQLDDLRQFEQWICKVLYITNERKALRQSSKSSSLSQKQERLCQRYCIETELSVLEAQSVIGNIFFGDKSVEDSD